MKSTCIKYKIILSSGSSCHWYYQLILLQILSIYNKVYLKRRKCTQVHGNNRIRRHVFVDTFCEHIKYFEIPLISLWDSAIIKLVKFEVNLKTKIIFKQSIIHCINKTQYSERPSLSRICLRWLFMSYTNFLLYVHMFEINIL